MPPLDTLSQVQVSVISRLPHIALGLPKNEKIAMVGIKTKHQMAVWDEDYLAKLLFQQDG
jgi:hypothetical protein